MTVWFTPYCQVREWLHSDVISFAACVSIAKLHLGLALLTSACSFTACVLGEQCACHADSAMVMFPTAVRLLQVTEVLDLACIVGDKLPTMLQLRGG